MNTENKPMRPPVMTAVLSVLLFWSLMVCLMILLNSAQDSGMGGDAGGGSGTAQSGNGAGNAAEDGGGSGAAEVEAGGTETGTGNGKAEHAQTKDGEGEGDREPTAEKAEDQQKHARGERGDDETADGDGGKDEEETSVDMTARKELEFGNLEETPPDMKKTQENARKNTVKIGGKTTLSGSEAGRMKGFFGSGKISGHVLFLLDVSGSMMGSTPEGMSRLDLLKRELKKVMQEKMDAIAHPSKENNYGDDVKGRFLIATFSDSMTCFPERGRKMLSFNSKKDLKEAIEYVDGLSPCGGTNMQRAWNECDELFKKWDIDWVYFLSDGEPTDCTEQELLKKLKPVKQRIRTFSLGVKSSLMEKLAKMHRGHYWEIY